MDCRTCNLEGNERQKEIFGCEEPAREWVATILCPRCNGLYPEVESCPECNHEGQQEIYRCPRALLDYDTARLIPAIVLAHEGNSWPVAGGLTDQSPAFVEAVFEYRRELEEFEKRNAPKEP